MKIANDETSAVAATQSSITGGRRRTLEAIFHHPSAHNLEWSDVVGLIEKIGHSREKANNEFVFEVAGKRHVMRKPHAKDLTTSEVIEVRHFLIQAGMSPESPSQPAAHASPAAPSLLIVVDRNGTKIFQVDVTSDDASEHLIRPHDLHHFVHESQSREEGQKAPQEPANYEKIANAVTLGGEIVVVGHGVGKSNAAHHLIEYLRSHHPETYQRIVCETVADLSSVTTPQLLDLSRQALRS